MYKLLKNIIIRGDRRVPPDLYTLVNIMECAVLNNYLYFRGALWIPNFKPIRMAILYKIHDSLIAGHPGKENTFVLLTRDFYWLICKLTAALSGITKYAPIPRYNGSKKKAF